MDPKLWDPTYNVPKTGPSFVRNSHILSGSQEALTLAHELWAAKVEAAKFP